MVNQYITEAEIVYKSDGQQFQTMMEALFDIYVKNSGRMENNSERLI